MNKILMTALVSYCFCLNTNAQKLTQCNLVELLNDNQIITDTSNHAHVLNNSNYTNAISTQGVVWLKGVSFKEGSIDIDLCGKNVFLQSFLGVAFHATDNTHYEVVYFRPFNFQHADTSRRKWSVQYMVVPDFLYDKLRKEHPLVYENSVIPVPKADEWFHATIVIKGDWITVYVNHSPNPSLQAKKLNTANDGMIGLWDDELTGDFANLTIRQK
jgi:hypothetical protein